MKLVNPGTRLDRSVRVSLWPLLFGGVLPLMTWLLGACKPDPVDQVRPDSPTYPTLDAFPRAVLGGTEASGPSAFGRIRGVAVRGDSVLAVADGMSQEIKVFDSDGQYLRTFGGEGSGPGRTRAIRSVSYSRTGGLCVWDRQLSRITHLGPDGSLVGTWSPRYDGFSLVESVPLGFSDDCSAAVFRDRVRPDTWRQLGEGTTRIRQLIDTIVYTAATNQSAAKELARVAAPPAWLVRSEHMNAVHDALLGERLHATLVGTVLWFGTSETLYWRRIGLDMKERETVRLPTHRRRATNEDIESERARRMDAAPWQGHLVGESQARQFVEAYREGVAMIPGSEFLPAYDAMVGGADRTFWVREPPSARDQRADWLLIDEDGAVLGQLSLPVTSEIVAGSASLVVTRQKDEFDVEYLRVFDIR